jgi:hypothetical protein
LIRRSSNVQRGISRVDIPPYLIDEEWLFRLSRRSLLKRSARQLRRCRQKTRNTFAITGKNALDQLTECRIRFDH